MNEPRSNPVDSARDVPRGAHSQVRERGAACVREFEGRGAEELAFIAIALLVPLTLVLAQGATSTLASSPYELLWAAAVLAGLACSAISCLPRRGRRSGKVGTYTLEEKIGEGGMAIVYRAKRARSSRLAAVKVLPGERASARNRARFEREVQRTTLLRHPNTISIFDFGRTSDGGCYYAMEYVDGLDLQALVERDGPLEPARVADILFQTLSALTEAHRIGLVHRDVKPANIMARADSGRDIVKVLDFGLVRDLTTDGCADMSELVGTPLYLSPEAITQPDRVDARSDLYALGAVGYFLLTGQPPYSGRNFIEVCTQHLHGEPVPPSQRVNRRIPGELESTLLACLRKSPHERPDANTLMRLFERLARTAAILDDTRLEASSGCGPDANVFRA